VESLSFETVYRGIQGAREIRPLYITVALSLPQKRHVIYLVWLRETTMLQLLAMHHVPTILVTGCFDPNPMAAKVPRYTCLRLQQT
jgi:hypothetical protein